MIQKYEQAVNQHYGRGNLGATILTALEAAGKNPEQFTLDDLASIDHLHTARRQATLDLMHLAALQEGMEVLDVGGGLGGPARLLAAQKGCKVTVLDLTEEYCQVGEMLTARTGLSDRVSFQQGNALDMPFPNACFDVVWTQHSTMNIADKSRLYAETHRVLRPAGRLAFHEVMAGPVQPIHFPVPWAHNPDISFLRPPEETRALLLENGFKEISWIDTTAMSVAWFQKESASQPPLGIHSLLGPEFGKMFSNQARNAQEHRIAVIQAIFERIT